MAYISNTITDPNSPAAMCTALEAALTSVGYILVDTVVISTRTHRIWQNPAANNPLGQNWYFEIAYATTGAGTFGTYIMEDYNPATDQAFRMADTITTFTPSSANFYSPFGSTGYTLEHSSRYLRSGYTNYGSREVSLPTSSFGYWASVTATRVVMMFSTLPDTIVYSGIYEVSPQHASSAGANDFPLVSAMLKGDGGGVYDVALTRFPALTISNLDIRYMAVSEMNNLHIVYRSPSIPGGTTGGSARFALRVPIQSSTNGAANVFWGWFIDIAGVVASGTVTRGDTVSDPSSNTWTLTTPVSGYSLMIKQV